MIKIIIKTHKEMIILIIKDSTCLPRYAGRPAFQGTQAGVTIKKQ